MTEYRAKRQPKPKPKPHSKPDLTPQHGPVRQLVHKHGQVCNLLDADAQRRSIAALLAKKYCWSSQRLRNIHNLQKHKELTEQECLEVHRIVGGLSESQKTRGIKERAAEILGILRSQASGTRAPFGADNAWAAS